MNISRSYFISPPSPSQATKRLADLDAQKADLEATVKKYKDSDPKVLEVLAEETKLSKTATNRWTDNIYNIQSWIDKKFPGISVQDLNKQFGVPEDLDYVDE